MNDLILAAFLQVQKPDFPSPQQIATTCEQSVSCATAKAEETERLAVEADVRRTAEGITPTGTYYNNYSWGNCTEYVASRVQVPDSMGNAHSWGRGLLSAGWRTGEPRRGAVGVTQAGWAGHVVLLESVNGDGTVTISEMNYYGLGVIDTRVALASDFQYFYR